MCLRKPETPVRADKDIICYKLLSRRVNSDGKEEWRTPYMFTPISEEQIKGKKPFQANGVFDTFIVSNTDDIEGGAIHTYCFEYEAGYDLFNLKVNDNDYEYDYHLFECIIPKGTLFISGKYGDSTIDCYASKSIIIKKQIA
jgi:hypothetical protein